MRAFMQRTRSGNVIDDRFLAWIMSDPRAQRLIQ